MTEFDAKASYLRASSKKACKSMFRCLSLPRERTLPSAIMCYAQADQSWRVGNLSRVDKSGDALYVTADRRLSVTVHANGIVATPTNRPPVADCYGKTLDELRSSGRLIEPQRAE